MGTAWRAAMPCPAFELGSCSVKRQAYWSGRQNANPKTFQNTTTNNQSQERRGHRFGEGERDGKIADQRADLFL